MASSASLDVQTTTGYTRITQQDVRQALETLDDEGGKKDSDPTPQGMKFRGENYHEIAVVAPTGYEPVLAVRHALLRIATSGDVDSTSRIGGFEFGGSFESLPRSGHSHGVNRLLTCRFTHALADSQRS